MKHAPPAQDPPLPQDRQALTKTDRQKDRRARKREQREAVGGRGSKCGQSSVRTKYSRASRRDLKVLHSVERERGREREWVSRGARGSPSRAGGCSDLRTAAASVPAQPCPKQLSPY